MATISGCASRISIHPPRVGRDLSSGSGVAMTATFQSTLPVWGGTDDGGAGLRTVYISIHPPRVGRDPARYKIQLAYCTFQSTLPVWGGTGFKFYTANLTSISIHPPRVGRDPHRYNYIQKVLISIHPPRVGRDASSSCWWISASDFNPPSPCGEGRQRWNVSALEPGISIHPPRVGRDCDFCNRRDLWGGISIHPPRVGRDSYTLSITSLTRDFNPPSPCGEGHFWFSWPRRSWLISIHPPRVGRDTCLSL